MSRKRKTENIEPSGTDGILNSAFSNVVKSVSELHLYAQSQLTVSFQAGEYHGLEKLLQWITQQNGSQLTVSDVMSYLQGELMRVRNVSMAPEFQTQRSLPTFRMQLPSVTAPIPNIGVAATYSTIPPSTHREGASLDITFGLGSYSLNDPQGSHSHGSDFVGMRMYNSGEGTSYGNLHFVNKTIMENFLKITDAPASASRNNTEDYISQVHIHDAFEESMMDMHIEGPGK